MIASDLDGTLDRLGTLKPPQVCISGRTWAEYDDTAHAVAQRMPLYIRGTGAFGDQKAAAAFKVTMILLLGVTVFYEDDPIQAAIISRDTDCEVVKVS